MPSSCLECNRCKPCSCSGVLALFGRRGPRTAPPSQKQQPKPTLLRRAFSRMTNRRRRRHRTGSFSSVRAVFWPLMSMGSDVDRADVAVDRPRRSSTDSVSGAVCAPSPSLDNPSASRVKPSGTAGGRSGSTVGPARAPPPSLDTPAASTTAKRVLALQARLTAAAALAPTAKPASTAGCLRSIAAACDGGDVEEACRGFERHLTEMLIEEGKVGDLMDVEELLCCWAKLRSPAFVRLVGRFYGELCMDLFSDVSSESP